MVPETLSCPRCAFLTEKKGLHVRRESKQAGDCGRPPPLSWMARSWGVGGRGRGGPVGGWGRSDVCCARGASSWAWPEQGMGGDGARPGQDLPAGRVTPKYPQHQHSQPFLPSPHEVSAPGSVTAPVPPHNQTRHKDTEVCTRERVYSGIREAPSRREESKSQIRLPEGKGLSTG